MLKRTERQVFSYDLMVKARAQHATPPSLIEIADVLSAMVNAGNCTHERERGSVVYRIAQILKDDASETLSLLIRRCDTNAANAVYSNRHTGVPRIAEKQSDEGGDRAAHVVLSLRSETTKPHSYLCHLEGVPGLSHRLVQALLNAVLKDAIREDESLFQYNDPSGARRRDGSPKTTAFVPTLELLGHVSPQLASDIENGTIKDIVLVDQTPRNQLGGNKYLIESENRIKVKVDRQMPRQNRLSSMLSAFKARQSNYQTAKILFTDPEGQSRSIDYDISTGTPEQQNYIQSYTVREIDPPMNESCETFVDFLKDAIRARVISDRS